MRKLSLIVCSCVALFAGPCTARHTIVSSQFDQFTSTAHMPSEHEGEEKHSALKRKSSLKRKNSLKGLLGPCWYVLTVPYSLGPLGRDKVVDHQSSPMGHTHLSAATAIHPTEIKVDRYQPSQKVCVRMHERVHVCVCVFIQTLRVPVIVFPILPSGEVYEGQTEPSLCGCGAIHI